MPYQKDKWPPRVRHNSAIEIGDGSRFHYCAPADVLALAGVLDEDEIPGNPACRSRAYYFGEKEGKLFFACSLGRRVAVTLLGEGSGIIHCAPMRFKVR